jgi:hypothetical protein
MNSPQNTETDTVHVQAHYAMNRKLGHWTTGRHFEVRAMRGGVVLDLRSPQIPEGDIEIAVLADHSMIKLLVADDAVVDTWDLEIVGRGRVKDGWFEESPTSRRIKITGQLRHGEVRIRRGGGAVFAAMFTREAVDDVRRAYKDGTYPTVIDPANTPANTRRAK